MLWWGRDGVHRLEGVYLIPFVFPKGDEAGKNLDCVSG